MKKRRVVVTGMGLLSPLGWGPDAHLAALRSGRVGVVPMEEWTQLGLRCRFGGPVDPAPAIAQSAIAARRFQTMGALATQAVLATEDALRNASLDPALLTQPGTACILGAGVGSMPAIYEGARLVFSGKARRVRPFSILQSMSSAPSAHVTQAFGIGGPSYTVASACASSAHAIGHSYDLIAAGSAERAVTGGVEELNVIVAAAFEALRTALSREQSDPFRASAPFDAARTGLVLAGGAGILVLEERAAAQARGATIWGEILGHAANSHATDLVLPEASGEAAAGCMRAALRAAGLDPRSIEYVNAHATGTPAGDLAEGRALFQVFGGLPAADPAPASSSESLGGPWVGSTKGLTGHALGAAGGLEAGFCLLMLRHGFLAAMPNFDSAEPEMPSLRWLAGSALDLPTPHPELPHAGAKPSRRIHLCNSFGFGGTNASLVIAEDAD